MAERVSMKCSVCGVNERKYGSYCSHKCRKDRGVSTVSPKTQACVSKECIETPKSVSSSVLKTPETQVAKYVTVSMWNELVQKHSALTKRVEELELIIKHHGMEV
jgi:hypothetical protein